MDEIEARIFAIELVLTELMALTPPDILAAMADNLRDDTATGDEAMVRAGALELIEHGRKRDRLFS